jgi:hypothetical protein
MKNERWMMDDEWWMMIWIIVFVKLLWKMNDERWMMKDDNDYCVWKNIMIDDCEKILQLMIDEKFIACKKLLHV